ncbi:uncharacterized protein LOC122648667 [Telopea speciosissima]|uniref:uncharacterized protein LOC122648667 n=1 Tax=Telopea speciosissima TaxID=54955 RepID=UPI001CC44910|nr:uncharacterized protein LOC122648667 [Telopea speciosissima]
MTLVVGDSCNEAYSRTRATKPAKSQVLILRREHVVGNKYYTSKARFGGKTRDISIDCRVDSGDEPRHCFSINRKRVLQVKRLKWKFRGNERIEVDGVTIQQQQLCGFFMNGFEWKKMKKTLLKMGSSSSSSMSSASSGCSSSVLEWASIEEGELQSPSGFSLLVYAWKK